jgi:inner membrane protein
MMFKTHLLFGVLVALFTASWLNPPSFWLFLLFVMIGTVVADVDHPNSKIGKNVAVIGILFKHRGFFHSVFAVLLFTILVHALFESVFLTFAFSLGYFSHLAIDCFNHQGIMPLHPLSQKKVSGFMKTNGPVEWILMVVICVGVLILIF